MRRYFLVCFLIVSFAYVIRGYTSNHGGRSSHRVRQGQDCPDPTMCRSKWGYCGNGDQYCGDGCVAGPCYNHTNASIITDANFACAFNTINDTTRAIRLNALRNSGWIPTNNDEAAVFLGHVFYETDGLNTLREYCAPGNSSLNSILLKILIIGCGPQYAASWCSIQGAPGKWYYGRGWFQLSWPCNYYAAGQSLGIDLLNNPDVVEQQDDMAVKTAIWFYNANNMGPPAQAGDFAATTRIINGKLECNGGPEYANQLVRVATYKRIRYCFNLGEPTINPIC